MKAFALVGCGTRIISGAGETMESSAVCCLDRAELRSQARVFSDDCHRSTSDPPLSMVRSHIISKLIFNYGLLVEWSSFCSRS